MSEQYQTVSNLDKIMSELDIDRNNYANELLHRVRQPKEVFFTAENISRVVYLRQNIAMIDIILELGRA